MVLDWFTCDPLPVPPALYPTAEYWRWLSRITLEARKS